MVEIDRQKTAGLGQEVLDPPTAYSGTGVVGDS